MILCISTDDVLQGGYPIFGSIHSISYFNDNLYFRVKLLHTIRYSQDFCAFNVEFIQDREELEVSLQSIPSKYPFALWKNCTETLENQRFYVPMKTMQFT